MILNEKTLIDITERNVTHFKELGYNAIIKEKLEVDIKHLSRYSRNKINIKCDNCNKESIMTYNKYMDNFDRQGFYTCRKCSGIKKKNSFMENFGNDPDKLKELDEKRKSTNKLRNGDGNYNNLEKHKETNIIKFGHEHHLQNKEIFDKLKQTNLERYGTEITWKSEIVKQKSIMTKINRYGLPYFNNPKKSSEFKFVKYDFNIVSLNDSEYECECDNGKEHNFIINKNLFYYRLNKKSTICLECNPLSNSSEDEKLLLSFITDNYNGIISTTDRTIISPYQRMKFLPY